MLLEKRRRWKHNATSGIEVTYFGGRFGSEAFPQHAGKRTRWRSCVKAAAMSNYTSHLCNASSEHRLVRGDELRLRGATWVMMCYRGTSLPRTRCRQTLKPHAATQQACRRRAQQASPPERGFEEEAEQTMQQHAAGHPRRACCKPRSVRQHPGVCWNRVLARRLQKNTRKDNNLKVRCGNVALKAMSHGGAACEMTQPERNAERQQRGGIHRAISGTLTRRQRWQGALERCGVCQHICEWPQSLPSRPQPHNAFTTTLHSATS